MAENLQDLKEEVVKVEVPSLKEMSVDRIFHLLDQVTECQKYFSPLSMKIKNFLFLN